MPFLGRLNGERVIPPQVSDETTVNCGKCGDPMCVVPSHERGSAFVSRHFSHFEQEQRSTLRTTGQATFEDLEQTGACPGESDEHLKMKSIAYERLQHEFPDARIELEGTVGDRYADVLLTFDEPRSRYCRGIAVEVQYRNHGKNIDAVTDHYLSNEFSVNWLEESDFSGMDVDFSGILTVWPSAVPDRQGMEGYPDVVRWLWQEQSPAVSLEVPIPGAYWTSFDKSDEWVMVAERSLRQTGRAWVSVSRSPTGELTLQVSKREPGWNAESHRVTVQLETGDWRSLHTLADSLDEDGFGDGRPSVEERDLPWHDIGTAWLAETSPVTSWLSASISDDGNVVLTLGQKYSTGKETVSVQIDETAVDALREVADLFERAFEIEFE